MHHSIILSLFFVVGMSLSCMAQTDNEPYDNTKDKKEKVDKEEGPYYIGGDVTLQFGNITNIRVAPHVGYYVSEDLSTGIGVLYQYYKQQGFSVFPDFETSIYGGSAFARYDVAEQIFLQSEFEVLSLEVQNNNSFELGRQTVPTLLLGAGYKQGSKFSHAYVSALYDVLQEPGSPYARTSTFGITGLVLRVGFNLGL